MYRQTPESSQPAFDMDPISAIAGISTVCGRGAKILVAFYDYIAEIRDVPRYIENLTSELSAVNAGLQQVKAVIVTGSYEESIKGWAQDLKLMVSSCDEAFSQIESMIGKAKIETKSSAKGQVTKCIKWVWSKKQVLLVKERLESFKGTITLMLEALNGYETMYCHC